jgi:hypothetical protein
MKDYRTIWCFFSHIFGIERHFLAKKGALRAGLPGERGHRLPSDFRLRKAKTRAPGKGALLLAGYCRARNSSPCCIMRLAKRMDAISQKNLYNALLLRHLSAMAEDTPGYRKRQLLENYCAKMEVDPNKTLSEYYKASQTLLTKGTSLEI